MKKIVSVFSLMFLLLSSVIIGGITGNAETTEISSISYTIQDMKNLQNFLLAREAEEELSEKSYDMNNDGVWNVFDLCLMKQQYLKQNEENTSSILVAYFSATGNTENIANHIVNITGADTFEIEAAVPYTNEDLDYTNSSCRANQEQNDKTSRPEISGNIENMDDYDVVFLGYPIWWGEEPRIIDAFLESYDFSDKTVIPFCTSGSSGITASERNIANLGVPIGNQLAGRRFAGTASEQSVSEWIDTLELPEKTTETKMNIEVNGHILTATLADNSSAKALAELLTAEPITLELNDYANFEKVGALPQTLPRNDEPIDTDFGDIILYQGNQFVLYYDTNSWTFTRLGHIDNITNEELQEIL
ncbi:MAG: flavodoxin, partial [Ruminococcus sp.]